MAIAQSESGSDCEYRLPRGGRESIRLTAQHHMLTARQGWLLHPEITKAIQEIPNPQIADLATGTGIWALELSQRLPHADIIGLDVSDRQFCPQRTLPANMSLGLCDLLQEVPVAYQGKFDVVHIRLILPAGPGVDRMVFINHFRALLKPGGWLQWDDLSFPLMSSYHPSQDLSDSMKATQMVDHPMGLVLKKYTNMKQRTGWFDQFEKVMRNAGGFDNAQRFVAPTLPHLLQIETDLVVAVMTEFFEPFIHRARAEDTTMATEMQGALEQLHADADSGVLYTYPWNVGIAMKV